MFSKAEEHSSGKVGWKSQQSRGKDVSLLPRKIYIFRTEIEFIIRAISIISIGPALENNISLEG